MEELSLHKICIAAIEKMIKEGITRHVSYANPDDQLPFDIPFNIKIPKVTIEWVDASEAMPERFEAK
jgi:hypothetical protein